MTDLDILRDLTTLLSGMALASLGLAVAAWWLDAMGEGGDWE